MGLRRTAEDAKRAARDVLRMAREPAMCVWGLYLLLVPVYVISSGLPQPGDWLIPPLLLLAHNGRRGPALPGSRLIKKLLVAFVIYVTFIDLVWTVALGTFDFSPTYGFLMAPMFYIFNAVLFFTVLRLYQKYRGQFLWFTAKIVFVSLMLQIIISAFHASPGLRVRVLFNNANQLGFYALLSASLLFLLQRRKYVSSTEVTIALIAAVYLCLLSASKAALGSIAILSTFAMVVRMRTVLIVGCVIALSLLVDSPINRAVDRTMTRFETDQSHPQIEERGYDRIYNNPQYLITGSGEGDYQRFRETTVIGKHEIHSSIGTLLFCYGFVGFLIFAGLIWTILRGSGFRTWLLVAPSFAFSMAHLGLRFTLFWVLLGIVVSLKVETREAERAAAGRRLAPIASS